VKLFFRGENEEVCGGSDIPLELHSSSVVPKKVLLLESGVVSSGPHTSKERWLTALQR
jgi:hypothetical protein